MNILGEGGLPVPPNTLLLLAVVVIISTLMWSAARRRSRRSGVDGRTGQHARLHQQRLEMQAREDLDELMVRLEELSREICGQIDTRFAKLERVLAEADEKLARLGRLRGPGEAPSAPPPPADPRHVEIFELAQSGQAVVEIARRIQMPAGEVELVLALERSRRKLAAPPVSSEPSAAASGAEPAAPAPPAAKGKRTRVDKRA